MPEFTNLYSILHRAASIRPEHASFVAGKRRFTYRHLLKDVDRAADMFWQLGVRSGNTVAIVLRNSPEYVISYFALAKLGAVSVPINFLVSKVEEVAFILSDSGAKGVVTENEFLRTYLAAKKELPELKFIISTDSGKKEGVTDFWHYMHHLHRHDQTRQPAPGGENKLSILYTSGTTGNPKGVMLSHYNIISNAKAAIETGMPCNKDVFICVLPMFHTFACTLNVVMPVMLGCKTVIVKNIVPPKPWLQEMGREGVTILAAVPQIFGVLAKEAKGIKKFFLRYWSFRKLRLCVSGAAPLPGNIKNSFEDTFNVPLLEGYGLTETSPFVSCNLINARKHGSVGLPLPGVSVKIVNEEGITLNAGEEGEILVKGPNTTRGYHGNTEATEALFSGDGWLKTGDIGVIDKDGFLFIRDRKKDMVIVKGLKVFPAQIEQIINHHPKIQENAVIGLPSHDGNETMKCFVVPKQGEELEKHEVTSYIKQNLDPYKRPKDIEIVSSLPKNSLQKVLKRELVRLELEKRAAAAAVS